MKKQSNLISLNLSALRQYHKYSQEEVAEKIGVSRQAVAKWESGETVPDILNCDALAKLYNVSIDVYKRQPYHCRCHSRESRSYKSYLHPRLRLAKAQELSCSALPDIIQNQYHAEGR